MDKILVVGGTGFIGSHLVKDLIEKNYKVFSISKKKRSIKSKAIFFFLDLSKKFNENLIRDLNPNIIIYTASLNHSDADNKFEKGHKVGYLSLINLLNNKFVNKKLKRIIFLSTAQVYKNYCKGNINTNSEVYPKNAYSFFHIQSENFLKFYSKKNNIGVDCLRISNGYGDPVFNSTNCWSIVVNNLCLQAFKNRKMIINSNPNEFRNFIYVKDISKEIIKLLSKDNNKFLIKNIGSKKNVRIKEIVKTIRENLNYNNNKKIKVIYKSKTFKRVKMYKYNTNSMLNSKQPTNLKNGIKNLIKFIVNNNGKV